MSIHKKGECIRNVSNFSKQQLFDKIDKKDFDLVSFTKNIYITSPKLKDLITTIQRLDNKDYETDNKLYKHIIYTDIKNSASGAKMIAAGLMAYNLKNVYDKTLKINKKNLTSNPYLNFALLCSTSIYEKPFPTTLKKNIIEEFNKRPDNINGKNIRFIILDQGYKEGIDLFDVKYVHLFEPLISDGDERQVIGRATRYCGQKGLEFIPNIGWELNVFKYDIYLPDKQKEKYKVDTLSELFIQNSGIDMSKIIFATELENICKFGAVDYELNYKINNILKRKKIPEDIETYFDFIKRGKDIQLKQINNHEQTGGSMTIKNDEFYQLRADVRYFMDNYKWDSIKMENKCIDNTEHNNTENEGRIVSYTPTQSFVSNYFSPYDSPYKGLLLWHSVGTGKTCTAIATASNNFEAAGYTILWVTKHTLKSEIWKNMYQKICSSTIKIKIGKGEKIPLNPTNPLKYLNNWITPISYKQFSNMLLKKNDIYKIMVKKNGASDPLQKTLVIIDEVHKLFSNNLPVNERPNLNIMKKMIRNSYKVSGKSSVKLLLMSATPYSNDPMDMIRILNLMKETDIPENFEEFKNEYLGDNNIFTDKGSEKFLSDITGIISYLNRENDVRQFAYPVYYNVKSYLSTQKFETNEELLKEKDEIAEELERYKAIKLKGKTKDEKENIKLTIEQLIEKQKDIKIILKEGKKNVKEDLSQESALKKCFTK